MHWLVARLTERSTYQGLGVFLVAFGLVEPGVFEAVVDTWVIGVGGLVAFVSGILPDKV